MRLPHALAVLVALALIAAAVLKVLSPYEATAAMRWTGLPYDLRMALVYLGCWVETVVGLLVLLLGKNRWSHLAMGVLCLGLLVLHFVQRSSGSCGCFGSLAVPESATIALLIVGVFVSAALVWRLPRAGAPRWARLGLTGFVALIVFVPLLWVQSDAGPPELTLVARDDARSGDVLYVIGSQSCHHCAEVLEQLRARDPLPWQVVFVERENDTAQGIVVNLQGVSRLRVPENLWWNLIADAPPAYVVQRQGATPQRSKELPE